VTLIAITSPGDHPGATTTAFAMTLTWPGRVLLAECSPAGGHLLRGYFQCHTPPDGGLWNLALAAVKGQDSAEDALWEQTMPLDAERQRLLLPGLIDPFLSTELSAATWETLAATFADLPFIVLADAGPILPEQPYALLRVADLVIVVMRPTLAQVAAARPRLTRLRQSLGPAAPPALCLVGDRPYSARDIKAELGEFAFTVTLPVDAKSAEVLSEGGGSTRTRRKIEMSPLILAARQAGQTATNCALGQRRALRGNPQGRAVAGGGRP
jgi:hypothetical protein